MTDPWATHPPTSYTATGKQGSITDPCSGGGTLVQYSYDDDRL